MNLKLLGGILLIVGTSIGGGMLALPISAAPGGLFSSSIMLISCWAVMTFCAFLILEVNLRLPERSNLVSMARATLGNAGAAIMWIVYLLLLYCLLAAYTSSGADMLRHAFSVTGLQSPMPLNALLYVGILGFMVYLGIRAVDHLTRVLILGKFLAFFALIGCIALYIDPSQLLSTEQPHLLAGSLMIMLSAFGFAIIVPSLRDYFNSDVVKLRKAILIGSLIPLFCYLIWNLVILSVIPREGEHGLMDMLSSGRATTDLPTALSHYLNNDWITVLARIFAAIAIATSFLGVALSTSDFLADGLNIQKAGKNHWIIYGATFIPPLASSIFYPNAFIKGLHYAGICCAVLLILYPALMAWFGRYNSGLTSTGYRVMGGKSTLMVAIFIGVTITILGWIQDIHGVKLFA